MTILITRPTLSDLKPEEITSASKKYHNLLLSYDILIENCDNIKNPALRIQELKKLYRKLNETYRNINALLRKIPATKHAHFISLTKTGLLKMLQDLRFFEYEEFKNELIRTFQSSIRSKLSEATLENTFDQTFYVYQDINGKETNKAQSARQYFFGVPRRDQSTFFYFLDWLSYIGGGFLIIPIKNTIKSFIEFLPNYMMNVFSNNLKKLERQNKPFPSSVDVIANWVAFGFFKLLHVLGRAIASPLTSAKIAYQWGQEIGEKLPTNNTTVKKVAGVALGILFALPSLAIGLTAVVLSILFVPTSIIWLAGKLPLIGIEAAAWLSSVGHTLGGLNGVASFTANNFNIASKMAPAFATEVGVGIGAFSQFVMFAQKALKLPALFLEFGQKISRLCGFGKPSDSEKSTERVEFSPSKQFEDIPYAFGLSYATMQKKGLLIETEPVVPSIPQRDEYLPQSIFDADPTRIDQLRSQISPTHERTDSFSRTP